MLRPMLRPLLLNPLRRIGTPAWSVFSPRSLFAAGEQGVWFDPSDLSTLFQDSGGTTPVTAAGQPVALVRDKSGRSNHLTLANCTLQQAAGLWYVAFNGTSSGGATAAINFSATDKMTVHAGLHKASDAARGIFLELATLGPGTFNMSAPDPGLGNFAFGHVGANSSFFSQVASAAAPATRVLTGTSDLATSTLILRMNGVPSGQVTQPTGGGNFTANVLNIGRRGGGTLFFNGRLYGLIVRGAASSAQQIASAERWMASRTGVVL